MTRREYQRTHPWITFRLNLAQTPPQLWSLLGEAAARCEQVAGAVLPPGNAREMHQVFLAKGVRATTAIEGNTLSEEQVRAQIDGELNLPPSQEYMGREVGNVLNALNGVFRDIASGQPPRLSPQWISEANRRVLAGLEDHLDDGVVPGEIPSHDVVVGRYVAAPRGDCRLLLSRLGSWLEDNALWTEVDNALGTRFAGAILRAILAHIYIAWIHPFGDGNGRTARLVEFTIVARAGVPSPCAHLLSNHYNATRAEYYRQLDRSSRANSGRGDVLGFVLYSLRGLIDGLAEQCRYIEGIQLKIAWEHFVYAAFRRHPRSSALDRRREVTLELGRAGKRVRKRAIPDLSTNLARRYAKKTRKTLTRDMNWLVENGFLERQDNHYRARIEEMQQFRPAQPG